MLSFSRTGRLRFSSSPKKFSRYKFAGVSIPTKNSLIFKENKKFLQLSLPISKLTLIMSVLGGSQSGEYIAHDQYEDTNDEDHTLTSKITPPSFSVSPPGDIDSRLKSLKLEDIKVDMNSKNGLELSLQIVETSKWIVVEKLCYYKFVKVMNVVDDEDEEDREDGVWVLRVGKRIKGKVSTEMQMKMFGDQKNVDLVDNGVWQLQFRSHEEYRDFVVRFEECLFENDYGLEATEANKLKVYGKDFIGW